MSAHGVRGCFNVYHGNRCYRIRYGVIGVTMVYAKRLDTTFRGQLDDDRPVSTTFRDG